MGQDFEAGLAAYERGDYAAALKEWRPLAEQGHAGAQFDLAVMYDNGEGVAQDGAQAVAWYRRAAEQGSVAAQNNLALMYANGYGVPRDYIQAYMWFNLAGAQGHTAAAETRDVVAKLMTPVQIAEAQRRAGKWRLGAAPDN